MLISRAVPVGNPVFWLNPGKVARRTKWIGTHCCHCSSLTSKQNGNCRGKMTELGNITPGRKRRGTSLLPNPSAERRTSHYTLSPDFFGMLVKTHTSLESIDLLLRMEQIIYLAVNHKVSPDFVQQTSVWQLVTNPQRSGISEGEIESTMTVMRHHFKGMKLDCISTSWFQV